MLTENLFSDYLSGKCEETWRVISVVKYEQISNVERIIIDKIILEALKRIDSNIKVIFEILSQEGFYFINFGKLNHHNQPYILRSDTEYNKSIKEYSQKIKFDEKEAFLPRFFASFVSYFSVIDFRGRFSDFDEEILLDPLFIGSFEGFNELSSISFDQTFNNEIVKCCMFSPDANVKIGASGDTGPSIIVSEDLVIDNFVVDFFDDFLFDFRNYLLFNMQWGCFPNLYWATDEEKKPFLNMLSKIRIRLLPF